MMEFRVPKFLERESAIAFGLTFKKLAVVGSAGLLLFLLFYIIPNKIVFVMMALLISALIFAFLFLKIKGRGVFSILGELAGFMFAPRAYFWQKKEGQKRMDFIRAMPEKEIKKKGETLRFSPPSRLGRMKINIDLGP